MVKKMALAHFTMQMGRNMKVIGAMTKRMEKVRTLGKKLVSTRETGRTAFKVVMEK